MDQLEVVEMNRLEAGRLPRRFKVLHVGKFYPPHMGGIETHLETLCRELRKSVGVEVMVANDENEPREEVLGGIPVLRMPTILSLASTPLCPRMVSQLRHDTADIIHIHLPNPMAVLAFLVSGHRGRLVVTYHSDTVRQKILGVFFEPLLHRALRRSSAIIATSPDYQRTSRVLEQYVDRCHVIPYGISLDEFEQCESSAKNRIRAQYGERLVISVGRLVYYKGFEYLIQAMKEVNGKLLIAGDGPLRGSLQELVRKLALTDKVVFLGEIQNQHLVPYYHAAEVFALASVARSEAFGIVQIEAMAAGLAIVNTKLDSGVPFVSLHEQTGLTVPPRDAQALARAINHLLDNPRLRQSLGAAGRLRAQQEFSATTMALRTMDLYRFVIERSEMIL